MRIKLSLMIVLIFLNILNPRSFANTSYEFASLQEGQYSMEATFKFSDAEKPVVGVGGDVTVTIKGSEIAIKTPIFATPIVAKVSGNKIRGELKANGAIVEFRGEIVEKDHVEGVFTGSMGRRKVVGIWTMKLSKQGSIKEKVS